MRKLRKTADRKSDRLNAFVAGAVAGLALAIDKDRRRRQSIMLYLLTRSIQFTGAWIMKQWALYRRAKHNRELAALKEKVDREGFAPGQPRQLIVKKKWDDHLAKFMQRWAGVAVMIIANAQIIYAFLFHSETLSRSYYEFLLTHSGWKGDFGGMAAPLTHAIGETVTRLGEQDTGFSIRMPKDTTSHEFIAETVSPNIATIIPPKIRHRFIMCALQHPLDPSCTRSKLTLFRDEYLRALKLYVPLNIVSRYAIAEFDPKCLNTMNTVDYDRHVSIRSNHVTVSTATIELVTIIFSYPFFVQRPTDVLRKFLFSCMRSSLFLAMYVTMGFATPCAIRPVLEKERRWMYLLPGAVAGSMTFLEARGRQLGKLQLHLLVAEPT